MSKSEEMQKFEAAMASDKELNEKLYKAVDRIAGEKTLQSDGDLFAKAAQELGFNLTAADFERLDAENEEVSPEELEHVAGGSSENPLCWKEYGCLYMYRMDEYSEESTGRTQEDEYGHNGRCLTAWHCYLATLQTDSDSKHIHCWSNYICALVNENPTRR